MHINTVLAGIAVSDVDAATDWYERFLGQAVSARPMPVLAEWHLDGGHLQLVHDPDRAGSSLITLEVADLDASVATLSEGGFAQDTIEITHGDTVDFAQVSDPDGNVVTVVQHRSSTS